MIVKELIDILQLYPDDMVVLVDGYEKGFDDPKVHLDRFKLRDYEAWYLGKYDDVFNDEEGSECVVVGR